MNFENVQKLINNTDYWDSRVDGLECNYFSDEVKLTFNNGECFVTCKFKECYRVLFDHVKSYQKNMPVKEMSNIQIPYFLNEIIVEETFEEVNTFLKCKISMFPLNIEILCKDVIVLQTPLTQKGAT